MTQPVATIEVSETPVDDGAKFDSGLAMGRSRYCADELIGDIAEAWERWGIHSPFSGDHWGAGK